MGQGGAAGALKKMGGVRCAARKKGGGTCGMPAGWGTNHYGIGTCKLHGGSTPNHVKAAASEEMRILLGRPIAMNPLEALLWCIRIRSGEVHWLSEKIATLSEQDWIEDGIAGKHFHLYVRERAAAMNDLTRWSSMAINLGIAERAVKLAETYGEMLAQLIQGILGDLELTEDQRAKVPQVVRRHLIMIDGGVPDQEPPPEPLQLVRGKS